MTLLALRNLTMRFGGVVALDSLSLDVASGQILGLIGPNGSGKTTCFNVMTGIYLPSAGSVRLEGTEISGLSPQRVYRAGIARTFQRSRLCLPLSIFDNLMIGNHGRLDHGLWFNLVRRNALKRQLAEAVAEARELIATFSPALAARLFDAVGTLPMIDRRRIEICRALISRPKVLLLDEPSAGMTPEETRQLMDDILEVRQRIARLSIIIIEHEMGVIERVTERCVVLNYGRKICEGAYHEVAADPEVRAAYLGEEGELG
jgi:ABC-type branched-subunit amino acid transport system ATPase component